MVEEMLHPVRVHVASRVAQVATYLLIFLVGPLWFTLNALVCWGNQTAWDPVCRWSSAGPGALLVLLVAASCYLVWQAHQHGHVKDSSSNPLQRHARQLGHGYRTLEAPTRKHVKRGVVHSAVGLPTYIGVAIYYLYYWDSRAGLLLVATLGSALLATSYFVARRVGR